MSFFILMSATTSARTGRNGGDNNWPLLASGTPLTDADHDGMPDTWETAHGLDPNDGSDRNFVCANGYTNLENYLNGTETPVVTVVVPQNHFNAIENAESLPSQLTLCDARGRKIMQKSFAGSKDAMIRFLKDKQHLSGIFFVSIAGNQSTIVKPLILFR